MSSICTMRPTRNVKAVFESPARGKELLKRIGYDLKAAVLNQLSRFNDIHRYHYYSAVTSSRSSIDCLTRSASFKSITCASMAIGLPLTILFSLIVASNSAYGQNSQAADNRPAIITLNGMHLIETLLGSANPTDDRLFSGNYVADALAAATPYRACLRISDCEIFPIPFAGNLRSSAAVRDYIRIVRDYILAIRTGNPARPIVIVAHSWGSVVAYQALSSISRAQMLSNNVALVISLGSPLQSSCANFFATRLEQLVNRDLPGRELLGQRFRKPAVVDRWLNYYNTTDYISGSIGGADDNYEATIPALSRAKSILPKCNEVTFGILNSDIKEAHSSYYQDGATLRSVIRNVDFAIRSAGDAQISCTNAASQSREFGSPVNLFERDRRLFAEARCSNSTNVEIVAGHHYPQQYTYRYGYYYNGERWVRFQFAGSRSVGDWFAREVTAQIPIRELRTSKDSTIDRNRFVFYTCWDLDWRNRESTGNWKCGCQTAACPKPYWQAVDFRFVQGGR